MNKYEAIVPISRSEAEGVIRRDQTGDIPQDLCISLSNHKDKWVRRACATCFGHLARIHGKIEREKINPVLMRLLDDPDVAGFAQDSLNDLDIFLK